MIRDRIVVGLKDANLSKKLQLDSELTLKRAQDIVRETEAVKKQQTELRSNNDAKSSDIDAIRSGKYMKQIYETTTRAE